MLDKSIPYKNIIMKLDHARIPSFADPILPDGFTFRPYQQGDAAHWARIETAVAEFDAEAEAQDYFIKKYLPHVDMLPSRCVFVLDAQGLPVATATAWYEDSAAHGRQASLHWVAVCPACQGLGLGRAVVTKALGAFPAAEPGKDVFLHTQTWSHPAVRLYHKLGFVMMKTARLGQSENNYDEAVALLKEVIPDAAYRSLTDTAE